MGLLLQLAEPTSLSAVAVDLNSSGTVVQIRASASATPAKLSDTTELSPPGRFVTRPPCHTRNILRANNFRVVLDQHAGLHRGKSRSDISELTLQSAVQFR